MVRCCCEAVGFYSGNFEVPLVIFVGLRAHDKVCANGFHRHIYMLGFS